jgi:hypothetical protein
MRTGHALLMKRQLVIPVYWCHIEVLIVAGRVPHHHEVITKVYTFRLLSFLLVCPKSAAHAASGKWGLGLGTRALLGSRLEGRQESSI